MCTGYNKTEINGERWQRGAQHLAHRAGPLEGPYQCIRIWALCRERGAVSTRSGYWLNIGNPLPTKLWSPVYTICERDAMYGPTPCRSLPRFPEHDFRNIISAKLCIRFPDIFAEGSVHSCSPISIRTGLSGGLSWQAACHVLGVKIARYAVTLERLSRMWYIKCDVC